MKNKSEKHPTPVAIIGSQLIALRKKAGLSQAQVIAKSILTPKRIVDLEQGRTNYTIESLLSYLKAIGKDLFDLEVFALEAWVLNVKENPEQTKKQLIELGKTNPEQAKSVIAILEHLLPEFNHGMSTLPLTGRPKI